MIRFITSGLSRFIRDEEGASGIEYALVAAMVAIILVGFIPDIQDAIREIFTTIKTELDKVDTGAGG